MGFARAIPGPILRVAATERDRLAPAQFTRLRCAFMTQSVTDANDARRFRQSIRIAASFVALLWLIQLVAALFDLDLVEYGIYPRRLAGAIGIVFAPLIHGSFSHLIANSLPIFVLGTALLYGYPRSARLVLGWLYAGSGLGVWLFARNAYHVGASGVAFGMMFFVFTIGALRWDRRAIALSMLVFFLYGGMVWGIFPTQPDVSYESHFFGALLGVVLAIVCRNRDPAPPQKRYTWEDEEEPPIDGADTGSNQGDPRRTSLHQRCTPGFRRASTAPIGIDTTVGAHCCCVGWWPADSDRTGANKPHVEVQSAKVRVPVRLAARPPIGIL